jgi:hypothetical protein
MAFEMVRAVLGACAAGILSLAFASTAAAAGTPEAPLSVVIWTEGPDKDLADAKATAILGSAPSEYTLVDDAAFQKALVQQGHRGALAPALKDPKRSRDRCRATPPRRATPRRRPLLRRERPPLRRPSSPHRATVPLVIRPSRSSRLGLAITASEGKLSTPRWESKSVCGISRTRTA